MELKFLLKIEGHHGIPDGEWARAAILGSDDQDAVIAEAKTLIAAEYTRFTGKECLPAEVQVEKPPVTYNREYLDVQLPISTSLRYSMTPVLMIGSRAFVLTEADL